jgi:hypothetical protein
MKRVAYILIGVIIAAAVAFVLGSLATNWYSDHLARSDDDMNLAVKVFLPIWLAATVAGGVIGNLIFKRKR